MIGMEDQGGPIPPQDGEKRKRRRFIILGVLIALLVAVGSYGIYYLQTQKPITELPVVRAVTRNTPPHFLFNIYGVTWPIGVATSHDGQRIYVAEGSGERQLRIFDRQGREIIATSPPDSTPLTRLPIYVAVGPDDAVYVTDQLRLCVDVYDSGGNHLRSIQSPYEDKTWMPIGVAVAPSGDIYVSDITPGQQSVAVFGPAGEYKFSFGEEGKGLGQMNYPNDVAVDRQGRVFVGSNLGNRVDVFGLDGTYLTTIGAADRPGEGNEGEAAGGIGMPRGLYVDNEARLYAVDAINASIMVFDTSDKDLAGMFKFGSGGRGDGQFRFPHGVAADGSSRVYLADWYNNRVQVWSY